MELGDSRKVFEHRAALYDQLTWVRDETFATEIVSLFQHSKFERALDLACGTGFLTQILATHSKRTYALDLSPKMLLRAASELKGRAAASCIIGDGECLPFSSQAFDLLLCRNGLHHFSNPSHGLLEIKRVLRVNGQFILVEPVAPFAAVKPEWAKIFQLRDKGRHPTFYFTEEDLIEFVAKHDFRTAMTTTIRVNQSLDNWLNTGCLSTAESASIKAYLMDLSDEKCSQLGLDRAGTSFVLRHKWALLSLSSVAEVSK